MSASLVKVIAEFSDISVRANLQETALKDFTVDLKHIRRINPYSHQPDVVAALDRLGIPTSPFSGAGHPHGAIKAIENQLLFAVGSRLPKASCSLLFLKPAKLQLLGRSAHLDVLINQELEPRDAGRYPRNTIRKLIGSIHTPVAYMSDTLHFWSPEQLLQLFADSPCLQTLYATVVLPVEALHRHPSLHPEFYEVTYDFGRFQYSPTSHPGGAYCHEFSTLNWLKYNRLQSGRLHLTVQKEESLGANHLLCIKRGHLLAPAVSVFSSVNYACLPMLFSPSAANASLPYDRTFLNQMYLYTMSIKVVTLRDLFAKVRQLIRTSALGHFSMRDILHVCNYFLFLAGLNRVNDYEALVGSSMWRQMIGPIQSRLRAWVKTVTGASSFDKLLTLSDFERFTYSIELATYECHALKGNFTAEPIPATQTDYPLPDDLNVILTEGLEDEVVLEALEDLLARRTAAAAASPAPTPDSTVVGEDSIRVLSPCEPPKLATPDLASPSTLVEPDVIPWLPILAAHGFTNIVTQHEVVDGLKMPIQPITHTQLVEAVTTYDTDLLRDPTVLNPIPRALLDLLLSWRRRIYDAPIDRERAVALMSDFKNGHTGVFLSKKINETWTQSAQGRCEADHPITAPVCVVHGAGGSGKSQAIQRVINSIPQGEGFTIVVPSVELRDDWCKKLPGIKKDMIKTFEKALKQPSKGVVVLDDYGKLPAGYVEAFAILHQNADLLLLVGDYRQSVHHEENTQARTACLTPNIDVFAPLCDYYVNATHRNARVFANLLGVYGQRDLRVTVGEGPRALEGRPILTPTRVDAKAYADVGYRAYTYAGCQGLTTPKVNIVIDRSSPRCSTRVLYTALSRAESEIFFVSSCSDSASFSDKLALTPYLKTFLSLVTEPAHLDSKSQDVEDLELEEAARPAKVPPTQTHLPVDPASDLLTAVADEAGEKFERELHNAAHGHSNVFQTEDPVVQLFAHQQAKDATLMDATCDARLTVSSPLANEMELLQKKDIGHMLFENYAQAMELPAAPIPFDADLWRACRAEVEAVFLEKTAAQLLNSIQRQSPDFGEALITLFLKSQWVTKMEKLGGPAKAGQTIASFAQETVMRTGTFARYMRRQREKFCPANVLLYCEVAPKKLERWLEQGWNFSRPAFANDYTAYDQSQDGAMLDFELTKARFHNIPTEEIEFYRSVKINAKVFLGVLSIMRLTGEGPTWDANTECNIAFNHMKHAIPKGTMQCYAGDDLIQDLVCSEKASFQLWRSKLTLVGKPQIFSQTKGDFAEFCGWNFTPIGPIKNPAKLYASLKLGLATGRMKQLALSYAQDVDFAYSLGDGVMAIFNETEARYHFSALRLLHKAGYQPPSAAASYLDSPPPPDSSPIRNLGDIPPASRPGPLTQKFLAPSPLASTKNFRTEVAREDLELSVL